MCFWALFHTFLACFWRAVLAGTPQRTTRRDQSESAQIFWREQRFLFCVNVFFFVFCFVFQFSVFCVCLRFSDRALLFVHASKKLKKLKMQKQKHKKNQHTFLFEKFRRARAPATAPSRTKFGEKWVATGSTDFNEFEVCHRSPFGASARHGPTSRTLKWREKGT